MTEPSNDPEGVFICSARDPEGVQFSIQVVPALGIAGPVFIAGDDPLVQGPVLRFLNRVLARVQRPKSSNGTMVIVISVADDEAVHIGDAKDLEQGRASAKAIADQIRAGTFVPS